MDNYYDSASGEWVTDWDRYKAVAQLPRFTDLDDALYSHPDRAWLLLLDLLASVPEDTIHYVGAGPLETFIHEHGPAFVAQLEAEAHSNSRFPRRCPQRELRARRIAGVDRAAARDRVWATVQALRKQWRLTSADCAELRSALYGLALGFAEALGGRPAFIMTRLLAAYPISNEDLTALPVRALAPAITFYETGLGFILVLRGLVRDSGARPRSARVVGAG